MRMPATIVTMTVLSALLTSNANGNRISSMSIANDDIKIIKACVSALAERAPFLVDGIGLKQHSETRITDSSLDNYASLDFFFDGCSTRPGNPNRIDDCGIFTTIACGVDKSTYTVWRLFAPKSPKPYSRRIEYIEVNEDKEEWDAWYRQLKNMAENGDVSVTTRKSYRYVDGRWMKVGETDLEYVRVADFIEDLDKVLQEANRLR